MKKVVSTRLRNKINKPFLLYLISWLIISAFCFLLVSDRIADGRVKPDFLTFYLAGNAVSCGADIYDVECLKSLSDIEYEKVYPYLYPPLFAQLFSPLSNLKIHQAQLFLTILNILLFSAIALASLASAKKMFHLKKENTEIDFNRFLVPVVFSIVLIFLLAFRINIKLGQANIFVLALICIAIFLYTKNFNFACGLALSIAVMIKITPLILLIFFFATRKYKVIAGCIGGLIALFLISVAIGGFTVWEDFSKIIYTISQGEASPGLFPLNVIFNFSFFGVFSRIFGEGAAAAKIFPLIISIILCVFSFISIKKLNNKIDVHLLIFPLLVLMIVIPPLAYSHHIIYLFPGALLFLSYIFTNYQGRRKIFYLLPALLLFAIAGFDFLKYYYDWFSTDFEFKYLTSINLIALLGLFVYYQIIFKKICKI